VSLSTQITGEFRCLSASSLADRPERCAIGTGVLLAGISALCALVGRMGFFGRPFGDDPAIFIYMGKFVSEGGRLYQGLFDTKPPGVAMLMSGLWHLLGAWWVGYVILQMLLSALAAWGIGMAAGRAIGPQAQRPTTLFAAVYLNFYLFVFSGFQLETLLAAFSILAAVAALGSIQRTSHLLDLLVGLSAGCAAMIKPGAAAVAGAYLLTTMIRPSGETYRWWKQALWVGLGLAIPAAVVLWWCWEKQIINSLPMVWHEIQLYSQQTPLGWPFWIKLPLLGVVFGFPLVLRQVTYRKPAQQEVNPNRSTLWVFAILWLGLELVGVVLQRRMYLYYFLVLVPPMALIYGLLPRPDRLMPTLAGLLPAMLISTWMSIHSTRALSNGIPTLSASRYLIEHTRPQDAIWGEPMARLLLETNRPAGARFATAWYFANHDLAPRIFLNQLLEDWNRTRPLYIVLPANQKQWVHDVTEMVPALSMRPVRKQNFLWAWGKVDEYLDRHYKLETTIDGQHLYRRTNVVNIR
jgi:hypothetical protein